MVLNKTICFCADRFFVFIFFFGTKSRIVNSTFPANFIPLLSCQATPPEIQESARSASVSLRGYISAVMLMPCDALRMPARRYKDLKSSSGGFRLFDGAA